MYLLFHSQHVVSWECLRIQGRDGYLEADRVLEAIGITGHLLDSLQPVFPGVHILEGCLEEQRSPLDASFRIRVLTEGAALCTICISVDFPSNLVYPVTSWSILREEPAGHEHITWCGHQCGHCAEGLEDICGNPWQFSNWPRHCTTFL